MIWSQDNEKLFIDNKMIEVIKKDNHLALYSKQLSLSWLLFRLNFGLKPA